MELRRFGQHETVRAPFTLIFPSLPFDAAFFPFLMSIERPGPKLALSYGGLAAIACGTMIAATTAITETIGSTV